MIIAQNKGDNDAFKAAAKKYAFEERRKNHHVVANELERLLANAPAHALVTSSTSMMLGFNDTELPRDRERGVPLVELIEPQRSLDDLILSHEVRSSLDRLIMENRRADLLRTYGIRPGNKYLFCGPPGCGKTVATEAVASTLYLPLVLVRFDAVVSSYLGETAANLGKVFDFARSRPMVVLFDEFDAVGKRRTAEEEHGELKRVVNSFLQLLDGFRGESIIVAATNHQGLLDSALWRRFDDIILFQLPDEEAVQDVLWRNLRQIGVSDTIRIEKVATALAGMSHADIERVAIDAIKETILHDHALVELDILMEAVSRQLSRMEVTQHPGRRRANGEPLQSKPMRKKTPKSHEPREMRLDG